ncbi:hypothetical protein [Lysinibacillus capsici]|uniref:hypothetical protein n=1 Tax=Lysinibacillus capsici TaxID=2115968 RepID=UPI0034E5D2BA
MKLLFIAPIIVIVLAYICSLYLYLIIKLSSEDIPRRMVVLITLIWLVFPFLMVLEMLKIMLGRGLFKNERVQNTLKDKGLLFRLIIPIFGIGFMFYLVIFKASSTINGVSSYSIKAIRSAYEQRRLESEEAVISEYRQRDTLSVFRVSNISIKNLIGSFLNDMGSKSQSFLRPH